MQQVLHRVHRRQHDCVGRHCAHQASGEAAEEALPPSLSPQRLPSKSEDAGRSTQSSLCPGVVRRGCCRCATAILSGSRTPAAAKARDHCRSLAQSHLGCSRHGGVPPLRWVNRIGHHRALDHIDCSRFGAQEVCGVAAAGGQAGRQASPSCSTQQQCQQYQQLAIFSAAACTSEAPECGLH